MYAYVHDIYEKKSYPVVRHVFVGKTKDEAARYYKAHRKTDEFLRQCEDNGHYDGISCHTKVALRDLDAPENKALLASSTPTIGGKPTSFWYLAVPVFTGQMAALGAGWVTRKVMADSTEEKRGLASAFVGVAAFWTVAGLAWTALNSK